MNRMKRSSYITVFLNSTKERTCAALAGGVCGVGVVAIGTRNHQDISKTKKSKSETYWDGSGSQGQEVLLISGESSGIDGAPLCSSLSLSETCQPGIIGAKSMPTGIPSVACSEEGKFTRCKQLNCEPAQKCQHSCQAALGQGGGSTLLRSSPHRQVPGDIFSCFRSQQEVSSMSASIERSYSCSQGDSFRGLAPARAWQTAALGEKEKHIPQARGELDRSPHPLCDWFVLTQRRTPSHCSLIGPKKLCHDWLEQSHSDWSVGY